MLTLLVDNEPLNHHLVQPHVTKQRHQNNVDFTTFSRPIKGVAVFLTRLAS